MNKLRFVYKAFFSAAFLALLFLFLTPPDALTEKDGAQAGNSGAPGNDTCATSGCHDSFTANSGDGAVTITTPAKFEPGEIVTFTVRVAQTGASRFGFQANIRQSTVPRVTGKLMLGDNTKFSDAIGDYITHAEAAEGNGSNEWTFQWQAPDEDVGDIIIYVAGVAGNSSGTRFGDRVYTSNATLPIQVANEDEQPITAFDLQPAYPNPFQQKVFVRYNLNHSEPVRVALYDALGRIVKTIDKGHQAAGTHEVLIDGDQLPAGTYFYEVQTPTQRESRMLTRVK